MRFPFVDRLGTGLPFRYASVEILQAPFSNIEGSRPLQETYPGTFQPRLGGYEAVPGSYGRLTRSTGWNGTDEATGRPPSWKVVFKEAKKAKYSTEV